MTPIRLGTVLLPSTVLPLFVPPFGKTPSNFPDILSLRFIPLSLLCVHLFPWKRPYLDFLALLLTRPKYNAPLQPLDRRVEKF